MGVLYVDYSLESSLLLCKLSSISKFSTRHLPPPKIDGTSIEQVSSPTSNPHPPLPNGIHLSASTRVSFIICFVIRQRNVTEWWWSYHESLSPRTDMCFVVNVNLFATKKFISHHSTHVHYSLEGPGSVECI